MRVLIFSAALAGMSVLVGCSNPNQELIEEIDEHIVSLDSMQTVLAQLPWDSIEAVPLHAKELEIQVKKFYSADTIDRELARKMNTWKGVRKSLGKASKAKKELDVELPELKKQFEDLKLDAQNQAASPKQLRNDVNKEVAELNATKKRFEGFFELQRAEYQNYRDLLPVIDSLIQAITPPNE